MKRFSFLAGVVASSLVVAVAAPAIAKDAKASVPRSAEGADATGPAGTQRYCIVTPASTGTIVSRRECRTRAEWIKRGVDPLAGK